MRTVPVPVLSRVFRGKFVAGLKTAFHEGRLEFYGNLAALAEPRIFAAWLRLLFRHDWIVYAKPPFGGPEHALRYLSGYTHRVAISNRRLVALEQGNVTFRWRDSAHANKQRLLTLPLDEFLRRFLLHLLPRGFMRIRNFGFPQTGNALCCCLAVFSCSPVQLTSPLELHPLLRIILTRPCSASVLSAEAPCTSPNGSPPLNFCFAPRLSMSTPHEPATTASTHPRALARRLGCYDLWTREPDPHPGSLAGGLNQLVTGGSGRCRDLPRQSGAPHLPE